MTTRTLRIGTDLDGVSYNFVESMRSYLAAYRGFPRADLPEPTSWAMWETWPMTKEEWLTYFADGIEAGVIFGGEEGRAYDGTIDALASLRAQGHTVHIVTHRPPEAEGTTVKWLRHVGFPHDGLTFSEDKTVEPVDVMTEDNIDNALACAAAGIPVLLFDRPWNHDTWTLASTGTVHYADALLAGNPLITRVSGWGEAEVRILEMATERERSTANPKDAIGLTKPRLGLVPPVAVIEMSQAMANGADKYGAYNWRTKAVLATVYLDAAKRHIDQYLDGEERAKDSGVKHLAHAMACLGIVLDADAIGQLLDDRPPAGGASALIEAYTLTT